MEALEMQTMDDKIIITINKKATDSNFLINFFNRLRIEELIKKAEFKSEILKLEKNKKKFLEEAE